MADVVTWAFTVAATTSRRAARKNNRICFTINICFKKTPNILKTGAKVIRKVKADVTNR